jgi:hypothetical protein
MYNHSSVLPIFIDGLSKDSQRLQNPSRLNQGITQGLDMDGCHDKIIREAKALLHDCTNPHTL